MSQAGLISLCPRGWTLTTEHPSSTNQVLGWKPCDTTLRSQLKALWQSGKGSTNGSTPSAFSFFYVHVFTLYACRVRRAPMQRQRTAHGHTFPFHHVSPVDGTQLARLGSRHLYPLSHLTVHPTSQPFSLGSFSSQWAACCHFSSFGSSGECWA